MNLYALRKAKAENRLDEIDPEWRDRFLGDWQRAEEFYNRRPGRVVHSSPYEPPTVIDEHSDEDVDFDSDLEDRDEH